VECIDLSIDIEIEEDDSLVEIVDDDNNHYFGEDIALSKWTAIPSQAMSHLSRSVESAF